MTKFSGKHSCDASATLRHSARGRVFIGGCWWLAGRRQAMPAGRTATTNHPHHVKQSSKCYTIDCRDMFSDGGSGHGHSQKPYSREARPTQIDFPRKETVIAQKKTTQLSSRSDRYDAAARKGEVFQSVRKLTNFFIAHQQPWGRKMVQLRHSSEPD